MIYSGYIQSVISIKGSLGSDKEWGFWKVLPATRELELISDLEGNHLGLLSIPDPKDCVHRTSFLYLGVTYRRLLAISGHIKLHK